MIESCIRSPVLLNLLNLQGVEVGGGDDKMLSKASRLFPQLIGTNTNENSNSGSTLSFLPGVYELEQVPGGTQIPPAGTIS